MSKTKSSKIWLNEHFNDRYVKLAQQEGYRSRAAYKLLAIQATEKIITSGMQIIDLGAAPGGWSQVAAKIINKGRIIAVDLLPMQELPNVTFIQGDFTTPETIAKIQQALITQKVDGVISDMAPNLTGIRTTDQANSLNLAEQALHFAKLVLKKPTGFLLIKLFQGEGFTEFHRQFIKSFKNAKTCKPEASRSRSQELYLLGKNMV